MSINNLQDVIDSRDVIARIEELEAEREALADELSEALEAVQADDSGDLELIDASNNAAQELTDWDASDEAEELRTLQALASDASGYASDWRHGETLVRDSHFQDYAQQLAEDCGMIPEGLRWPVSCIDWEQAARELQMDYTTVDFDGVDYWIR